MSEAFDPTQFRAPHCNSEVLHAPGRCFYCDKYPDRQMMREASGTPFTPDEANGWSGNVAAPAGVPTTHMGATWTPGEPDGTYRCTATHLGYQCEARIRKDDFVQRHFGYHHLGALSWADDDMLAAVEPPERRPGRMDRFIGWLGGKMGF